MGALCVLHIKNRTGTSGDGGICSYAATADILALVSRISDKGKTYMHACANGDHETADKLYAVDYYNGEIMVAKIDKKSTAKAGCTAKESERTPDSYAEEDF